MWPLSIFTATIRYQMTHLTMLSIWSNQGPYKMSSNHIKGGNLGTIWLSYMLYFQPNPMSRFIMVGLVPLCQLVHVSFLHHRSSNHRIFSETAIHLLPEESLGTYLCRPLFFPLNVPADFTQLNDSHSDSVTGWDYLSVQRVRSSKKKVFLVVSFTSVLPWSCCRSHAKAAVWEWRGGGGQGRDNIWQWMNFLMSREDLHMGSGDCRGELCSRSGRRRWRDRKCTWAEDECQSGSEDTEGQREREQWSVTCQK